MQALKSLFRHGVQQTTKITPAQEPANKPTLLTPAEMKAVAGGNATCIPRIGGFAGQ